MKLFKPLSALLLLTLSANTVFAGEQIYTDGAFSESIYWTHEWGIFSGRPDGSFDGGTEMNRAELTKVLVLAGGVEENDVDTCAEDATKTFSDVPTDEWYTDYVYCAEAKGWVSGDDGTSTFRPGDPTLMGETFKMLVESQYGTPSESYEGDAWYDVYQNFLEDYQIIMMSDYGGHYYTYVGLGEYDDYIGFDSSSLASKMTRYDIAELLYRLRVVFIQNDAEPYDILYTFDEMSELYGTEFEIEDDMLSIADPYFGFRMDNIPLDRIGDVEDLRVYVGDPSGFEHGASTGWYLVYPYDPEEEPYAYWSSDTYRSFFEVTVYDQDVYDFWSAYDVFETDEGVYAFNCWVHSATSVSELLGQVCVIDEENNVDSDYTKFRAY